MTYCLGMLLDAGLILMADTRTNAGVDNFSTYRKLHTLAETEERRIYACTSGSLSITQAALSTLAEGLQGADDHAPRRSLANVQTMFQAASLVGEVVTATRHDLRAALSAEGVASTVSLLLGGRIGDELPHLYHVYTAGNFIECQPESPFLQIGETKYGKPILDRVIEMDTPIAEAVKIGFLSFDSAIRSNLGVAPPIDLMVMPADPAAPLIKRRIELGDAYFEDLSKRWHELLGEARHSIPNPPWMNGEDSVPPGTPA